MTFHRSARAGALLLLTAGLAACSATASPAGSPYGAGDPALAAPNPGGGPIDPFLSDGRAVLKALDAIAARTGKPLRVVSMNADQINGLAVEVQEPAKHANVDRYVVAPDGTIEGPAPVKMIPLLGSGPVSAADVDAQAFDPHAVAFGRLRQTVREAIAKSTYADARITQWEIDGIGRDDRKFLYFEAARARPVAEVDPALKIVHLQF